MPVPVATVSLVFLVVRFLRGWRRRRRCHTRNRSDEVRGGRPGRRGERTWDRPRGNRAGDLAPECPRLRRGATGITASKRQRDCVARTRQPSRGRAVNRRLLRRSSAGREQRDYASGNCPGRELHARARVIRVRPSRRSADESALFAEAGPATVIVSSVRLRPTSTESVRTRTVLPCAVTLITPRKRAV